MNRKTVIGAASVLIVGLFAFGAVWTYSYLEDQEKIQESQEETADLSRAVEPVNTSNSGDNRDDKLMDANETNEVSPMDNNPDTGEADNSEQSAPEPRVVKTGTFSGSRDYSASGDVEIIQDGDDVIIQFNDNFRFSGAPDTVIYLGAEPGQQTVDNSLILGQISHNTGEQAYRVTRDEFEQYGESIIIWCRAFSLYMGGANLS